VVINPLLDYIGLSENLGKNPNKMMVTDDLFLYVPVKTAIKWGVPHFQTDPYVLPLKYCMNPSEPTQLINQQTGAPAWSSLLLCFEVVTTRQWIVIHIDPKHWYGSWVIMVYPQNMIQQYPTYPCEIGERDGFTQRRERMIRGRIACFQTLDEHLRTNIGQTYVGPSVPLWTSQMVAL